MAKRAQFLPPAVTPASVTPQRGKELLTLMLTKGEALRDVRPLQEEAFDAWYKTTMKFIEQAFGSDTDHLYPFGAYSSVASYGPYSEPSPRQLEQARFERMEKRLTVLKALIEQLDTEIEVQGSEYGTQIENDASLSRAMNKVFLVHGHNHGVRDAVARFLHALNLEAIILEEQASGGDTIIEKVERCSDVGFAIVLLTGDDRGGPKAAPQDGYALRARQNVIFELGYFVGKVTRKHVCALMESGVEKPTDYDGVVFIALDPSGAWKLLLAREMRAAGVPVDMNRIV